MANPVKSSDIFLNDGAVKQFTDELERLIGIVNKLKGESVKLEVELKKANIATATGKETVKQAGQQYNKLEKELEKYNAAIDEHNIKIQAAREATRKANQLSKLTAKLKAAEKGSYDALSAQYSINKMRLNQMSAAQRKATKEGQQLEKQTNAIYQEMKALQEATGKHILSVGDYEKGTSKLLEKLEGMPGVLGSAANGVRGLGGQFKALLANPVVLFLSAIVAAGTALFQAFRKTERGANLMAKASGALQGILTGLVGIVDGLVTKLIFLFENPKQALKDFGQLLVDQVVNRFKAIPLLAVAVGKSFKALWNNDLPALKDAAKEAGQALIQMTTGIDVDQQNRFVNALRDTLEYLDFVAIAYSNMEVRARGYRKEARELEKGIARLRTEEATLEVQLSDTTKSLKEREEITKKLQQVNERRAQKQIQIARNELKIINEKLSFESKAGKEREALLDQQLTAYQNLSEAQRELARQRAESEKEQNELMQDYLERELDILIDGFDNQKTINEKKIASEAYTFGERRRLLEETRKLSDDSFNAQIAKIEEYTGVAIDANELINESDAVVLDQKLHALGLSDIITGRLLEAIRDRKSANYDLLESERALAKAEEDKAKKVAALAQKRNKDQYENGLKYFALQQQLAKNDFDLLKNTEAEKTRFKLESERDRWLKVLELSEKFGQKLSETEIKTIKATIQGISNELGKIESAKPDDIYSILGFKLDDPEKQALNDSFSFAKQQLDEYVQKRAEVAAQNVELSNNEVSSAENALQREIDNRNAGYAHNTQTAEKELKDAKRRQAQAIAEQRKAQREQEKIQTLQQTANLITASAKIWGSLGFPAAIPALGIMWGSFVTSKLKAAQLTKTQYGEGGYDILDGGSHASGNDTFMYSSGGKNVFGERGELVATINRRNTNKYRPILPTIIDSLNKGTFEHVFTAANRKAQAIQINTTGGTETAKMEKILAEIRDKKQVERFVDGKGRLIEIQGNTKRIYID
jgi:hypothetical protein